MAPEHSGSSNSFGAPEMENIEDLDWEEYEQQILLIMKKLYDDARLLQEAPPFEDEESYRKLVDRQLRNLMSYKHTLSKDQFDNQMRIFRDMCFTQVMGQHNRIEAKKEEARLKGEVYKYNVKKVDRDNLFTTATERLEFVQSQLEGFTPNVYPPTLEGKSEMALKMMEFYIYNDNFTKEEHMDFFRQGMVDRLLWDKTRFEAGHYPEFDSFEQLRDRYLEDIDMSKGLRRMFQV
ncbi:hypothetical protein CAEBREN_01629 [Caenorhabditis brenneri]|uniref:Uncharacterized protein n=1 Tax=Caenorhabditis brenneri TaxID=135651 RepID=G0MBS6_CAEBE|nr:hypothetical protein CAEBREN_01629 [Caenorhabditis brenneri]